MSDSEDSKRSESNESKSSEKKEPKFSEKKRKRSKDKGKKDNKKKDNDVIVGENEVTFLLDSRKRVVVQKFKGRALVNIREFFDDNGEMKPTKKGIALNADNWKKLKSFVEQIDDALDNV